MPQLTTGEKVFIKEIVSLESIRSKKEFDLFGNYMELIRDQFFYNLNIGNSNYFEELFDILNNSHEKYLANKIKAGISNMQDDLRRPAINVAAKKGYLKIIDQLINNKVVNIDAVDIHYQTPLHEACYTGAYNIADFLIKRGADPNKKDKYGQTPLHIAVIENNIDMVRLLLNKGGRVYEQDTMSRTPLDIAKENTFKDILLLLLKAA